MNKLFIAVAIGFAGFTSAVNAQTCDCTGAEQLKGNDLSLALNGNTVCVPEGAGWKWQEQHRTLNQLWDYKRGPGHPVDPTKQVGTWAVDGSGSNTVVIHTYGAQAYPFKVCRVGASASHGFCPTAGGSTVMATIKTGIGGCP